MSIYRPPEVESWEEELPPTGWGEEESKPSESFTWQEEPPTPPYKQPTSYNQWLSNREVENRYYTGESLEPEWRYNQNLLDTMGANLKSYFTLEAQQDFPTIRHDPVAAWSPEIRTGGYFATGVPSVSEWNAPPYYAAAAGGQPTARPPIYASMPNYEVLLHELGHYYDWRGEPSDRLYPIARDFDRWYYSEPFGNMQFGPTLQHLVPQERYAALVSGMGSELPVQFRRHYPWIDWTQNRVIPRGDYWNPFIRPWPRMLR